MELRLRLPAEVIIRCMRGIIKIFLGIGRHVLLPSDYFVNY